MLIAVVIGVAVFFLPVFPTISVTFYLVAGPKPEDAPFVLVNGIPSPLQYQKLSLSASANIPKGVPILYGYAITSNTTRYRVIVSIDYGAKTITPTYGFTALPGTYQMRIVYQPMLEQTNVPYAIHIAAASMLNQTFVGTIAYVYPS